MNIGIVGARKYRDKESVIDLISSIPPGETIITSSCKGVCVWAKEAAEERGMKMTVFSPDLVNIRSWFEVPKRYYERNKEMIKACDLLHAFISQEDGLTGGTQFEVEFAVSLEIPVLLHHENGISEWIFQFSFPFYEQKQSFFLSWERFFHRIGPQLGGQS